MKNSGQNYLITGATSALGKKLANTIVRRYGQNVKLMMLSRSYSKDLDELKSDSICYIHGIDLTNLVMGDEVAKKCEEFFEGPFSLIHCAGDFWTHVPFLTFSTDNARKMMDSHYVTLYAVLQSVLPVMIKRNGGKVIAFSFNSMNDNFPHILPYNAAKAAVEATVKCIAHEYAKDNIIANLLALASFKTEASKKSRPFGDFDNYLELSEISETVLDVVNLSNSLITASVINCYKYSDSYYNQGYFERIRKI